MASEDEIEVTQVNKHDLIDLTTDAEVVEKSFVSDKTLNIYIGQLVRFTLWIFDNKPEHIVPSVLETFIDANARDIEDHENRPTKRARRSRKKSQKKPKNNDEIIRRNLRAAIKHSYYSMKPAISGAPHHSPIIIAGEDALTYDSIRDFMMGRKKSVSIRGETVKEYMKKVNKNPIEFTDNHFDEQGKVGVSVQQSQSSYEGIRSAVAWIYKMARTPMPETMRSHLSVFIAGKQRTGLKEKENLGLSLSDGKKALGREAFELIAKTLFVSEQKEHIFTHLFFVLDWVLMKRAENCVNCKVNHISFVDDALVFQFAKSKGHQKGEQHIGPWHVYSNPFKPWMCPVLALSRYIFSFPDTLKGDMPLFEGGSQYSRYQKNFAAILEKLKPELKIMGYQEGDIGTHSCRKGVATFIASGCTVSPPIAPLCIRAGWVLGGMKDKYIFHENAGDQYVGRCASLLDQLSKEFAVSTPYFDFSELSDYDRNEMKKKLNKFVKSRIPNSDIIRNQTWNVAMNCFACVCYHYKYLSETLHPQCTFRASSIFRDIPKEFFDHVRVTHPWNMTKDSPSLTGVPPHVLCLAQLEGLRIEIETLKKELPRTIERMLDNRGFSSTGLNTTKVIEAITGKYETIVADVLKKIKF